MTGWQCHLFKICGIPCTQYDPSIIWVIPQLVDDFSQLIDSLTRIICPGIHVLRAEMPPLEPIYRPQVAFFSICQPDAVQIGAAAIAVPDLNPRGGKWERSSGAGDEPEEFSQDSAQKNALCG
jgi:hypothetical protein